MKWIDLPPIWLLAFLVVSWAQAQFAPTPFPDTLGDDIGALAILCGAFVLVAAALQFRRHDTTVMPRGEPEALITSGIYGKSRNPIYLADVLFLAGFSLWWGSVLGLVLVPVFMALLKRRFIEGEEARLSAAFGQAYEEYRKETRRWL